MEGRRTDRSKKSKILRAVSEPVTNILYSASSQGDSSGGGLRGRTHGALLLRLGPPEGRGGTDLRLNGRGHSALRVVGECTCIANALVQCAFSADSK